MKKSNLWSLALGSFSAAVLAFGFTGCDVDVEDPGQMPDVEVVEEGRLPDVEVTPPDVDVGTEKKEITVPDVDIDIPDENDQ